MGGPAQPGHVDQVDDDAVDDDAFPEEIARRPGVGRDDGPVLLEKGVEQGRLADVRPARDGQGDAFADGPAGLESRGQASGLGGQGGQGLTIGGEARPQPFLGEFEAGLDAGQQGHQAGPELADAPGQAAAELAGRDAGLGQGDGADEVVDGLRLDHIQAAVEVGPQGELAGPGQAGPGARPQEQDGLENGRAAVNADLDDVLARVRPGGFEIGQEGFVEGRAAVGIANGAEDWPPDRERLARPLLGRDDPPGHPERLAPADADDAQAAEARRRGHGDDGVFEHGRAFRHPILDDRPLNDKRTEAAARRED